MKSICLSLVALTLCATTSYAEKPASARTSEARTWALSSAANAPAGSYLEGKSMAALPVFAESRGKSAQGKGDSFADIALKISYVGSVLLTADRIVRSVDSVLDSMKIDGEDGTRLQLKLEPAARGVECMVTLRREF